VGDPDVAAGGGLAGGAPASVDAAQPTDGDVRGRGEQVVGCAVPLGAQQQPGDVPVGDLENRVVPAAAGPLFRSLCSTVHFPA
jgi:hypothetical protein